MMVLLHSGGAAQDIKLSRRCLFNLDVCRKGKLELGWRAKNQGFQKGQGQIRAYLLGVTLFT
jgi:hypothetical protein